ncbi:hypothetical protein D3C80_2057300 [compost metagenome]
MGYDIDAVPFRKVPEVGRDQAPCAAGKQAFEDEHEKIKSPVVAIERFETCCIGDLRREPRLPGSVGSYPVY